MTVFISYAHEDLDFARHLDTALKAHGLKVWFDVAGIYAGDEFWPQICGAIEKADTFIFIISPDAVESDFCRREIEHAVAHNKRIVPVLRRPADQKKLPQTVATRQWIFFLESDDIQNASQSLIEAIETDIEQVQIHTRLLTNAIDWDKRSRDNSFLLRSRNLQEAERWLTQGGDKEPRPTSLQTQYIVASREAATKRQRWVLGWVTLGLIVSSALAVIAFYQYRLSEARGRVAFGRLLASQAANRMGEQFDLALLLSLQAYRLHPSIETKAQLLAGLQHNPRLKTVLRAHQKKVESIAFSPDGNWLASGSADSTIILWDLIKSAPSGAPLRGHKDSVLAVSFLKDGKQLVSVGEKGTIIFWDIEARQMLDQLDSGHPEDLITAAFSKDKKTIALGSRYFITLWDLVKRQKIGRKISADLFIVNSLAFSPDGHSLFSGDARMRIVEWDVQTQQPVEKQLQSDNEVLSVAVSPDGKLLATGTKWITLWDLEMSQQVGVAMRGHKSNMTQMEFSPDGKFLVTANIDNTVRLWNVETRQQVGEPLRAHKGLVLSVAYSPDGNQIASGASDGTIVLWTAEPQTMMSKRLQYHTDEVKSVDFSPDGKILVSGAADGTIMLWDVASWQPLGEPLRGHGDNDIIALASSPDGKWLASASTGWTSSIRLWQMATRQPRGEPLRDHQVPNRPFGAFTIAFSPDSRMLASGGWDHTVRLWKVETLQPLTEALRGHQGSVISLSFSPDGRRLASGGGNGKILIWEVASGRLLKEFSHGQSRSVLGLAFSNDGNRLIAGDSKGSIIVWDPETGQEMSRLLPDAASKMNAIAFSPDKKRLASLHPGGAVWLWSLGSGQRLDQPLNPAEPAHHVSLPAWKGIAFSPDGKQLASSAFGYNIRLWDIDLASWQARICRRANRDLTREEWNQFIGEDFRFQSVCPNPSITSGKSTSIETSNTTP